jgi:hypothetical protein
MRLISSRLLILLKPKRALFGLLPFSRFSVDCSRIFESSSLSYLADPLGTYEFPSKTVGSSIFLVSALSRVRN